MFSLKLDRILTYTKEIFVGIGELAILAAFSLALIFWMISWLAPGTLIWDF